MEYFANFPTITLQNNTTMTNICARVDFFNAIKSNAQLFEELQILDGEKPEDVAIIAYNDPTLYWVILWCNDIVNVYTDWPLNSTQLMNYVIAQYGAENIFEPHHYETTSESDLGEGIIVNEGTPFSIAVSNFDYEDGLNEAKRYIKILQPQYISQVLQEYSKIF